MNGTRDFDSALTLFNRYKTWTLASGDAESWYSRFCSSIQALGSEAKKAKLAKDWVNEALDSDDPRLRALVSRHLPQLGGKHFLNLYLRQRKLRPGDFLEVVGYNHWQGSPKQFELRLERALLDSSLHPRGFARIQDTSIRNSQDNWEYRRALDSTGIYRLVQHGSDFFTEQYFQVSHLDMIVKTDGSKLLVWGSSYKDKLPAPYTIYFWNGKSGQINARSDAGGLAVFSLDGNGANVTSELRVAIRSGNNLAFSEAALPGADSEQDRIGVIYTDRPVYRPGHKVHFRGLVHGMDRRQRLAKASLDSVRVNIRDPQYEDYYDRVLPVDAWGHFGDSLDLGATDRQGSYNFQVYQGYRNGQGVSLTMQDGSFIVEAYKKPEFEVAVAPVKKHYVLGDTVRMRASGKYFFGRPLAGVPVRVRWYRSEVYPYYSLRGGKARFEFWPVGGRQFLRQDSLTLDGRGEAQFAFRPELTQPYSYLIAEVSAVDASRREVRAEAQVQVAKYRTFLQVDFDNYQYSVGDTAEAVILAADLDGKNLTGELSLRVKKDKAVIHEERLPMSSAGRLAWRYAPPEAGDYILEATLTGPDPKPVYQEVGFRVVAAEEQAWHWERIEFQTDRESYRPGDTARVTVQLGADAVPALLTAEGNALNDYRVQRIKGRKLEYTLPLDTALGLNVQMQVAYPGKMGMAQGEHTLRIVDSSMLLRAELQGPRTSKPGAAFRGSLRIRDVRGNPVKARFSVALVDEAIYAVAAKTPQGRRGKRRYAGGGQEEGDPSGLLSIFPGYYANRVNSAIDRIQANDLWQLGNARLDEAVGNAPAPAMRMEKSRAVTGFMDARSPQKAAPAPMAEARLGGSGGALAKAMGGAPAEPPPPRERSEFRDLGYWLPILETDDQGKGEIAFTLPDDLTRWRLLLRGNDGSSHMLDFKDSLVARQDLMVKLEAPRSLVVGDSLMAASVLHNYSDRTLSARVRFSVAAKDGEVKLSASGDSTVSLAPGATLRIDWPLHATRAGDVELATSVQSLGANGSDGDAERRTYPVRERGIPEALSVAGQWKGGEGGKLHVLRYPDSAKASSRRLEIDISPSLAWSMFQSLEYLTGYPYGCVEQTMSRFLPNLYVASALRSLGRKDDSLFAKLPEYTRAGLDRLAALRNSGGGWGWWHSGEGTPHMTALVVSGLEFALTQELSGDIKDRTRRLLQPGREALERMLIGMKPSDEYAYALHALSQSGKSLSQSSGSGAKRTRLQEQLEMLVENRGKLSSYGLALLLESLHRQGLHAGKRKVLELLATQRVETGVDLSWPGGKGYGWFSQDVESTAQVLRALTFADPGNAWIDKIIPYLSRKKHGGYWVSTKTTAAVIYALVPYLEKSRELDPDYALTVLVNGKELLRKTVTQADLSRGPMRVELGADQVGSENKLEIRARGKGKLYYQADLRWVLRSDSMAAKDLGIRIRRTYAKLRYSQNEKGAWEVKRVPVEGDLKSGDELEVSLRLTARSGYENMILEDFFPVGMEVVQKPEEFMRAWCGWWYRGYDHQEARDDRMVYFMDRVYEGERTFNYILRAETPGSFIALPARSELMYYPEISGHSASNRFRIMD